MNHWLIKSEPNTYSWDDLVKKGVDHWDGVRNFKARNNIKSMKKGDWCFFYHSVKEKAIVGIVVVVKEYYSDPTTQDDRWVVMDVKPIKKLNRPVTLDEVKSEKRLSQMQLVRYSRLSVQEVTQEEFDVIIQLSEQ